VLERPRCIRRHRSRVAEQLAHRGGERRDRIPRRDRAQRSSRRTSWATRSRSRRLYRIAKWLADDGRFDRGLDAILDGFEAQIARER
jgi:hypothetical protein